MYDVILFTKVWKPDITELYWFFFFLYIVLKTREQFLESWESSYLWKKGCFTSSSAGKVSPCNVGDLGLIPGLGTSPGEGNSYPLQYSGLENSVDCTAHGVSKSQGHDWVTFTFTFGRKESVVMEERHTGPLVYSVSWLAFWLHGCLCYSAVHMF